MSKSNWDNFGYSTDEPCCICGAKPAQVEPRFNYVVCEEHCTWTPIMISNHTKEEEK